MIPFDLQGAGGPGLSGANIVPTPVVGGGSGGEYGVGILFNDVTNMLTVNVHWGSVNGHDDLTGFAIAGHLHGPTATGGLAAYMDTGVIRYTLSSLAGWNSSPSSGGFSNALSILPAEVPALLNGQFYLLIHTAAHPAGEMRANLVTIPEPTMFAVLAILPLLRRRG
jgi:hypothetical protein